MRAAQMQSAPRSQKAKKLGGHILIPEQMLQYLKTNYFIERSSFAAEVVKIASFKLETPGICPLVPDQEAPSLLDLLFLKVHGHDRRAASIGKPRKVAVATTSVQYVSEPTPPEAAQRGTIASVQVETRVEDVSNSVTDCGFKNLQQMPPYREHRQAAAPPGEGESILRLQSRGESVESRACVLDQNIAKDNA